MSLLLKENTMGIKYELVFAKKLDLYWVLPYLNEIKNFKPNFPPSEKFIFVYQLDKNDILDKIIKDSSEKFNYKIYKHFMWKSDLFIKEKSLNFLR